MPVARSASAPMRNRRDITRFATAEFTRPESAFAEVCLLRYTDFRFANSARIDMCVDP
jgi:hypothetical protein